MYTKSHIVSILLLLVSVAASAQYSTGRVKHYLALSLGGGESNTFTSFAGNSSFSKDQAGGNALFNIAYELRKDQFFFGLGVGAKAMTLSTPINIPTIAIGNMCYRWVFLSISAGISAVMLTSLRGRNFPSPYLPTTIPPLCFPLMGHTHVLSTP